MTRTLNLEKDKKVIKFLYSYGGKILPRRTDGELCYVGGYTRIVAVDRSITFAELMVKFGELCGTSMILKCKLPDDDLDVLISITSDEDLSNVIDEYERASSSAPRDMKIRALLFPHTSLKKVSPPVSPVRRLNFSASKPFAVAGFPSQLPRKTVAAVYGYGGGRTSPAVGFPIGVQKDGEKLRCYPYGTQSIPKHSYTYLGHHWNHW